MGRTAPQFCCRLAQTSADLAAAHRLRYAVFVEELGADGPMVDHAARHEADRFDPFADHLILVDQRRAAAGLDHVVGVYRLLTGEGARQAGQFYSEDEYDLAPLHRSGRRLLELGRSCLHRDYRGGMAMMHLWAALADYIKTHDIGILFGVASFHGTDVQALAQPLSALHHRHLAPAELRVRPRPPHGHSMDILPVDQVDRPAAMRATPALIKAYLRLGGVVGEGAYVDHDFNTTDVCLILDTAQMSPQQRNLYIRDRG
ncbi:GNAT family N-acetyltransferase [Oceaniglobus ichthyenteri]|uniref:GNAT family N-acetyltransferase n=1 Tax=Oceaniglobus ichthyenteri TaxID=2136177 RepID=UPI000D3A643C|nr:GNAT family N-acyltransferase [Oceaniglobus ichthyenteri]